jgi:type I restriction enzyme, S subunit
MSWPSTRLTDLCTVITKGTTPTTLGFEFSDRGIGFLRVQNINGGSVNYERDILFIDARTHQALARSQIQPGDVLVSIAGTIGRTGVVPEDAPALNCNQALAIIRTNGSVFRPFLRHWLESSDAQRQMLGATVTGTISNLSLTQIGNLLIPLPPLPEQCRIAAVLDLAEALRAKRRAALTQLNTLTQAIFLDLFGDGNDKQWETRQLQDVVKEGTIVTYGIVQAGEEFPGGIPYIRTGDIVEGEIVQQGLRHTDPLIASRFERSRVKTGEIVMSIRATVGTTALVPPELDGANLTQGTARISPGSKVDRIYLLNWLRMPRAQHWISQQIKGATFREITLSRLRELPVTIPLLDLQQRFAAHASAVEKFKTAHRASLAEMDALFASLQYRAFRGEL